MILTQNRDGLPASIAELNRWVQRTASKHGGKGWNSPENWRELDGIDGDAMLVTTNTNLMILDRDHVINDRGEWVPPAKADFDRILSAGGPTYDEWSVSKHGGHTVYDNSEYPDSPLSPLRILYPEYENWDGSGKVPMIEIWYNAQHCFRMTGDKTELSTDTIMGGENAANALRVAKQIYSERSGNDISKASTKDPEIEKLKRSKEPIPDGSGHVYRRSRISELIVTAGDVLTDEQIAEIVLHEMEERFQGNLKESFYDNAVKDAARFRRKMEAGRKDRAFCAYSVRAWEEEHKDVTFDEAGKPWNEAFSAGLRAKEEGKLFNDAPKKEKRHAIERADNPKQTVSEQLPELTEQEAISLSSSESGPIPFITNMDGSMSKSSFTNYVLALQRDAYIRTRIRFNAFDGRITFTGFYWDARPHPARDADIANLRYYIDNLYALNNKANLLEAAMKVAGDNPFHPVREYLNRLKWDGVPRISELLPKYLGAERSKYTTSVTTLMLYGAIQRVMNPGCKFDYCIILADTKQGTGKSTLCRFLALNDEWYTDSVGNLSDSKSVFELMRGKWIIELGEMLAVRRAQDVETIKAFISRQSQDYRQPYGTFAENHPRQCIFIGTSNKPQFLPEDKTGNRRFLPVICNGDNAEAHPLANEDETREFIRMCYAEALTIGAKEGYPLVLDPKLSDELLRIQETATPEDTWIGMIQEYLDETDLSMVCTRLIWDSVFSGDNDREPKRYELNDIAEIMELHVVGWERYKGKDGTNGRAKYKFKVYGTQNAWQRVGGKREERFFDGDRGRHQGVATLPATTKEMILRHDEKVASGVASGVASIDGAEFESVGAGEKLPFD